METSTLGLFRLDVRRYGIAALSVVLAILAVSALRPLIGPNISPVLLAPWILLGAWYGGLGAGLMSTALNAVAAAYFIPPVNSFRIADSSGWVELAIFAFQGVLISWLCESRRRAIKARECAVRDAQLARAETRVRSQALAQADLSLKHLTHAMAEDFQGPLTKLRRLGDAPERMEPIDARRLIAQAMEETDAAIACDLACTQIEGDESQLLQVFRNLIDNAIKFRGSEPLRIRISSEQRSGHWVFSVADNGIGIVPAHWEEVFALGSRLHGGGYPGVGMGLPIAKRIVENHGGQIWLNSQLGHGTTVRFTIPRRSV